MPADQAQRSEQPTPRRKQKAREEGQVPSSRDLTAAVQFTVTVALLAWYGYEAFERLRMSFRGMFRESFRDTLTAQSVHSMALALLAEPLFFVLVFWMGLVAVGVVTHMSQTGFALTVKRLQPDAQRLNPFNKLRDLPSQNLTQTLKAIVMLPLMGWVFWLIVVEQELPRLLLLPQQSVSGASAFVGRVLTELLAKAALVLLILGLFDLYWQRRRVRKRLMMTKQEIRQEHKELEGNPQVKARLRRLQREMMRRRMISQVPKSTVVVTNPSHYAVALRYEPEQMAAPVVVAKGLDHLALRIRAIAEKHEIPIVENPLLAQALYQSAEIGSEIPFNLYHAVAEILAHIYRLTRKGP